MSHASFERKIWRIYLVGYSYELGGRQRRFLDRVYASSEKEALKLNKDSSIWSKLPSYNAKVVATREYS